MRANTVASVLRTCVVCLVLALVASAPVLAGKNITKVDVVNQPDRVEIIVQGDHAMKMSPIASSAGRFLAFQFPCGLKAKGRLVGIGSGRIYNVRYSNFSNRPPATRFVVNTSGHVKYSSEWSTDRKKITISIWKHIAAQSKSTPKAAPTIKSNPIAAVSAQRIPVLPIAVKNAEPIVKVAPSVQTLSMVVPMAPPMENLPTMRSTETKPKPVVRMAAAPRIISRGNAREPEETSDSTSNPEASSEARLSLNFLGADINDVLKAMSIQSGRNIVAGKDVSGSVTVSLSSVTLPEAMDYVAKLSGYNYVERNGSYLVASKDALALLTGESTGDNEVEVFALHYTKMKDVVDILDKMYPDIKTNGSSEGKGGEKKSSGSGSDGGEGDSGKKDAGKDINAVEFLVVSAPPATMKQVRRTITQLEDTVQTQMAALTTQVYQVRYVDATQLGETLAKLVPGVLIKVAPHMGFNLLGPEGIKLDKDSGSKVEQAKSKGDEQKMLQALTLTGKSDDVQRAMRIAADLDKKIPQLNIEAKVTVISENGLKKLGLNWEWGGLSMIETAQNSWKRDPINFGATLQALIENEDGELLASPNLMCVEGRPGVFFVGDEVHYIVRVETTQNGTTVITDQANVGVQLRVIADVNEDGYITLNLHPEVSALKLQENEALMVTVPIISRRFTDHTVRVKNGETIAIGGLIRDDDINNLKKVPVLGDVPLFGHLFRYKERTKQRTEVVMFIKAAIVED